MKNSELRIKKIFENQKAFITFLTAGDPDMESTVSCILAMEEAGASLVEIGIPFSDPTAEGIVIQEANKRALANGMNTHKVFEVVKRVREKSQIPLVFMTYLNPIFYYGYDAFFEKCSEVGIDGIIIPDLPYEEREEVRMPASKFGVCLISMVAPTSEDRIKMIAKDAEGFLYIVSSMGVTGVRNKIDTNIEKMVQSIREVSQIPCAIGFGISTPEQAIEMCAIGDGCIVGSSIVKLIHSSGIEAEKKVSEYVKNMVDKIRNYMYN